MTTTTIPTTIIPTTIIFVRHGNTFESGQVPYYVGRKTDLPLTVRGEQQAIEIAQELSRRSLRPNLFFSGDLIRQRRTAEIVAETLTIHAGTSTTSIKIAPCLSELDLGAWEGKTTDKVKQCYPAEYEAWERDSTWPQGIFLESKDERLLQLREWLRKLESETVESNNVESDRVKSENVVLAVTSNGILRLLYELTMTMTMNMTMGDTSKQDINNTGSTTDKNIGNSSGNDEPLTNQPANRKVGTGCFCVATLTGGRMVLREWNTRPPTLAGQ